MSFKSFPLHPLTLQGLDTLGFDQPTDIQSQVIGPALEGQDVCAIAATGSGKTGAFVIPILEKLFYTPKKERLPRVLVLVPTRELATQVEESLQKIGAFHKVRSAVIIGGESPYLQTLALKRGADVIIATPGRLMDHYERGSVILHGIQTVVLDEADRMLDMGFVPDIEKIMASLTASFRQALCFSATMPGPIKALIDNFLSNPVYVQSEAKIQSASTITQHFIRNGGSTRDKRNNLRALIKKHNVESAIIFCNRKVDVDYLAKSLSNYGFNAAAIHGDLTQSQRTKTLDAFRAGEVHYLIASDVAARGIDIQEMPCVINFELPINPEEYVHRVGRTGRAGKSGVAYSFIDSEKENLFNRIRKFLPAEVHYIDAPTELTPDPFAEIGYRKPSRISNFAFSNKPVVGFGDLLPHFIKVEGKFTD